MCKVPKSSSKGLAFGLFVSPASGGALLPLPMAASASEIGTTAFYLFPNPAKDVFTVSYDENLAGPIRGFECLWYPVYGETLMVLCGNVQIDINDWSDGFYFGRISTVNRAASFKIVVRK